MTTYEQPQIAPHPLNPFALWQHNRIGKLATRVKEGAIQGPDDRKLTVERFSSSDGDSVTFLHRQSYVPPFGELRTLETAIDISWGYHGSLSVPTVNASQLTITDGYLAHVDTIKKYNTYARAGENNLYLPAIKQIVSLAADILPR